MSAEELRKAVQSFRVSDLQVLLGYAGRNKSGKKNELQARALELLKLHSPSVELKIRELQKRRYEQTHAGEPQELYPMPNLNENMHGYGNSSHRNPATMNNMVPYIPHKNLKAINPMIPPYAVNPDVKLKDLPFYDVMAELLRPSSLIISMAGERFQEKEFNFHLTPLQAQEISMDNDVRVQLRICLLETSCEQDDEFPTSICVKVNKKLAALPNAIPTNKPGADPKRPKRPVDITTLCKISASQANIVGISWASTYGRAYAVAVYLVRRQTSSVLIQRLKDNGVRNPDYTTAIIKDKLCQDRDSEIATMSLRGSLVCPLGKIRMNLPCRALTCTHLQCFDASLYIQMNEKKSKWICPVCDKPALFRKLAIDGLFLDITSKAPEDCMEVQFHEDGSWTPIIPVKKNHEINDATVEKPPQDIPKPKKIPVEVVNLDSDSDTEDSWAVIPRKIARPDLSIEIIPPIPSPVKRPTEPIAKISDFVIPSTSGTPNLPSIPSCTTIKEITMPSQSMTIQESVDVNFISAEPAINCTSSSPVKSSAQFCSEQSGSYAMPIETPSADFNLYTLLNNSHLELPSQPIPEVISID